MPDLTKDKFHVWLTKYHWTSNVIVGVILYAIGGLPWPVTFSYGRALQHAPQVAWSGRADNVAKAQAAFAHRALMNSLAALGKWTKADEKKAA